MNSTLIPLNFSSPAPYSEKNLKYIPIFSEKRNSQGILRKSPLVGNHLAATRFIEAGEVIYEEEPILQFADFGEAHGNEDEVKYICLNCYATVERSEECEKCHWPLCKTGSCQSASPHCSEECKILAKNNIVQNGTRLDYKGIEILRCLLLRKSDSTIWQKFLALEPHILARKNDLKAVQDTNFVTDFIRNQCRLTEFDEELIARMAGVIAINRFGVHNFVRNRFASFLYDQLSFLLHDCNPNSVKEFVERKPGSVALRIIATRPIVPGEPITIDYINQKTYTVTDCPPMSLHERRHLLKEEFYFECCCQCCLEELINTQNKSN